ncbi:hypothetical protein J6590_033277 [Homalodisca vitripennis]|nr:hypothetical protein J6590_033277 [Homalodisca vitripennis]
MLFKKLLKVKGNVSVKLFNKLRRTPSVGFIVLRITRPVSSPVWTRRLGGSPGYLGVAYNKTVPLAVKGKSTNVPGRGETMIPVSLHEGGESIQYKVDGTDKKSTVTDRIRTCLSLTQTQSPTSPTEAVTDLTPGIWSHSSEEIKKPATKKLNINYLHRFDIRDTQTTRYSSRDPIRQSIRCIVHIKQSNKGRETALNQEDSRDLSKQWKIPPSPQPAPPFHPNRLQWVALADPPTTPQVYITNTTANKRLLALGLAICISK